MAGKKLHIIEPTAEEVRKVADAQDLDSLWIDTGLSDGITVTGSHAVTIDKPKTFYRTHPDINYRRRTWVYTHKVEGVIGEQHYIVAKPMRGLIENARPCTLVCVVYRNGEPRLWPIKSPGADEKDNEAWKSARSAAKVAIDRWVRIVWVGKAYQWREAQPGYAPDPDWSKIPPWDELVTLGFGAHGIIGSKDHPIYHEQIGAAPSKPADDLDGADL